MFDLQVFDQQVHWVDTDQTVWQLADLGDADLAALETFLFRCCDHFYAAALLRATRGLVLETARGTTAPHWAEEAVRLAHLSAPDWISQTPLLTAIRERRRRASADEAPEGTDR